MIEPMIEFLNSTGHAFFRFATAMLVQSSILIVLLYFIDLLLRRHVRAVFRYCVWMLVLVKLLLPPSLCLPTGIGYWCDLDLGLPIDQVSPASSFRENPPISVPFLADAHKGYPAGPAAGTSEGLASLSAPNLLDGSTQTTAPEASALEWEGLILLAWLLGLVALSLFLWRRYRVVRNLLAESEVVQAPLADLLEQCCQQVGMSRLIELRVTRLLASPAVCGLSRPVILMPVMLQESLSGEKLKAVLMHELAHVQRGDLWINFLQTMLQLAYFYNPLLWFANAIIRDIREKAVDETVLARLGGDPSRYTHALLDIAEMPLMRSHLGLRLVGVVESKRALAGRIKHILGRPFPTSARLGVVGRLVIALAAVLLLPMAKAGDPGQTSAVESVPPHSPLLSNYSVTGQVGYEHGGPLGNWDIVVEAWVSQSQGLHGRHYRIMSQTFADGDDGTYELKNLDGRPVYILARDTRANYRLRPYAAPTFYPGTFSRDEATLVKFGDEAVRTGIDFRFSRKFERYLEGKVRDRATGAPVAKALVTVSHRDMLFAVFSTYTDKMGKYVFDALGRGQFVIHVDARHQGYLKTRKTVTLSEGVRRLALDFAMQKGRSIRGRLEDEKGRSVRKTHYSFGWVNARGVAGDDASTFRYPNRYAPRYLEVSRSVWHEGGEGMCAKAYMGFPTLDTFHIPAAPPGQLLLSYHPQDKETEVKKILYQDRDITHTGLPMLAGGDIEDIVIVLGESDRSDATDLSRAAANNLSTEQRELVALIAEANRANRKRATSFDCRYTSSSGTLRTSTGRYAFSSNRVYSQHLYDDEKGGTLYIKAEGKAWMIFLYPTNNRLIMFGSASNRDLNPGTPDPWSQMDGDIGAKLDKYLDRYQNIITSVQPQTIEGRSYVVVETESDVPSKSEGLFSSHKMTCYFSVADGYLPTRIESQSTNAFGALTSSYRKEVARIEQYLVDGEVFYVPVEFEAEYNKVRGSTWRIVEESVRINPELPDDLFEVSVKPGDHVIIKDSDVAWPAGQAHVDSNRNQMQ